MVKRWKAYSFHAGEGIPSAWKIENQEGAVYYLAFLDGERYILSPLSTLRCEGRPTPLAEIPDEGLSALVENIRIETFYRSQSGLTWEGILLVPSQFNVTQLPVVRAGSWWGNVWSRTVVVRDLEDVLVYIRGIGESVPPLFWIWESPRLYETWGLYGTWETIYVSRPFRGARIVRAPKGQEGLQAFLAPTSWGDGDELFFILATPYHTHIISSSPDVEEEEFLKELVELLRETGEG